MTSYLSQANNSRRKHRAEWVASMTAVALQALIGASKPRIVVAPQSVEDIDHRQDSHKEIV